VSHANGEIWSLDGNPLGYFEYDGTSDTVCTRVHLKVEDVRRNWRADNWRDCECGALGQTVVLYSDYGCGFYWQGRVCWRCLAVTDGIYDFDDTPGHPFLKQRMQSDYGRQLPCPACKAEALVADGTTDPIKCSACHKGFWDYEIRPKALPAVTP